MCARETKLFCFFSIFFHTDHNNFTMKLVRWKIVFRPAPPINCYLLAPVSLGVISVLRQSLLQRLICSFVLTVCLGVVWRCDQMLHSKWLKQERVELGRMIGTRLLIYSKILVICTKKLHHAQCRKCVSGNTVLLNDHQTKQNNKLFCRRTLPQERM